jgi:hypothetical protein
MSDLPEPLTPADCDLRGMEWMPMHGHKLEGSDFDSLANDTEYRAAHRLWWAAWQQQVPAASLPDNDKIICNLAGFQRDQKGWEKVRAMALHGFVKCSDGRLYHRFLAPEAIIAWEKRKRERERKAAYRSKSGPSTPPSNAAPVPRDNGPVPRDKDGDTYGTVPSQVADQDGDFRADNTTQDRTGQDNKKEKERERDASADAPAPARRGTRIPPDWQPNSEGRVLALERGLNIPDTIANFRDFWHAKAGQNAAKMDWDATWRNWCRREKPPSVKPAFRNGFAELMAGDFIEQPLRTDDLGDFLRVEHVRN